jgi:hypothetical protein
MRSLQKAAVNVVAAFAHAGLFYYHRNQVVILNIHKIVSCLLEYPGNRVSRKSTHFPE